ncbi:ABC-type transport auxiliary lipoprotein family protein [Thermodesulfobacteriota bacterium]
MSHKKMAAVLLLGVSFLLGACLNLKKPMNRIEYYTLEYAPTQLTDMEPLPGAIRVERFTVAPIYNTTRIIYRDQSFKRDAYVYHQWRVNPGDLVTYLLNRDIRHSGLFRAVLPYDSRVASSYILEGSVDEFFERDDAGNWNAVLSLSITLMAENEPDISKRILFQKSYHRTEACNLRHPQALAEAMSLAMSRISKEIVNNIHDNLQKMKMDLKK